MTREEVIEKVCEAYDAVIEALQQPDQRWIPCSERLPEYKVEVLAFNCDGEYEVNHTIDEEDDEWFFDGVIAWMPLPEPYKEVQHE